MTNMRVAAFRAVLAAGLLTAALSASALAQQGSAGDKVVVINTQIFPSKIAELKQKYDQVEALYKDRYQKIQAMNSQAQDLDQKIRTQTSTLAADKVQEMQAQLEELKKRGSRELEDFQTDYKKSLEESTKPIVAKLNQFINSYATTRGIMLVLDLPGAYQTGTLAYWGPGTDITDDFVTEYNKANPVPGGAPAGPP
ncbi:MAG TPA: OmpH family outer membrane protein, partial [Blastocatellia bacterium]